MGSARQRSGQHGLTLLSRFRILESQNHAPSLRINISSEGPNRNSGKSARSVLSIIAGSRSQSGEQRNQRRGDHLTQCQGMPSQVCGGYGYTSKALTIPHRTVRRSFLLRLILHSKGITTDHPLGQSEQCPTSVPWATKLMPHFWPPDQLLSRDSRRTLL